MKIFIIALLCVTGTVNAKELIGKVTVTSIIKVTKEKYEVLFKEKSAIYMTSPKHLECLKVSIQEKRPILLKWDINKLEVIDCKSKRKSP